MQSFFRYSYSFIWDPYLESRLRHCRNCVLAENAGCRISRPHASSRTCLSWIVSRPQKIPRYRPRAQHTYSDSGYWTPTTSTTVWRTPSPTTVYWDPTTTTYWSTWTPLTTYTTCYTQQNVIVTVTSVLPCPITSTVVYWECCEQCQNNCYNPPTTYHPNGPTTYYPSGTTTVTLYTTTTPGQVTLQTITSNGLVIVMVSSSPLPQSATPSVVYQVSNQASASLPEGGWSSFWSMGMVLVVIATLMILL